MSISTITVTDPNFLAGVAPAVVGMLVAAAVSLGRSGLHSTLGFGVATLAFLLMLRAKLNPLFIIFGCGLLQFAVSRFLIELSSAIWILRGPKLKRLPPHADLAAVLAQLFGSTVDLKDPKRITFGDT